jgi:hypothetical protein
MGQIDRETDAALAQLENEVLSEIPGAEFAEVIGDLLMLVGTGGLWAVAGGASNLALKVRRLAGASYASNLIYVITAVRNDLKTLYDGHETMRRRIESLGTDPRFTEAISALALRAMHTSVKGRLKRLARIVVNGVKEDDLEPENLDDMMRAAVELKDKDIYALSFICGRQSKILADAVKWPEQWYDNVRRDWQAGGFEHGIALQMAGSDDLDLKSSLSRLMAFGFIVSIPAVKTQNSPGLEPYALLYEGKKFYERLQEIAG